MTVGTLMTADELLQLPKDGWRYELVRGELLKMSPAGVTHGHVAMILLETLSSHARSHRLGRVYPPDIGFRIARNPDTVRCADTSFVSAERVVRTDKYYDGAPDLVFEVVSPNDRWREVEAKTREWLQAGVKAVVTIEPETRLVRIDRPNSTAIRVEDVLQLDDVLPGWQLPLSELFA